LNYKKERLSENIIVENHIVERGIHKMRAEILEGLQTKEKFISSKYFYDKKGSLLFERITDLDEYYQTRSEKAIIEENTHSILNGFTKSHFIDLGSGDCSKIQILFDSVSENDHSNIIYVPVDISIDAIMDSAKCLSDKYPDLKVKGYATDFLNNISFFPEEKNKIIFFFGSTIGNFSKEEARAFITRISEKMQFGDRFVLGMDMVKSKDVLEYAYNDRLGITAEFNKNIINSINSIIETDIPVEKFHHYAFYNDDHRRIEMHLIAKDYMEYHSPHSDSPIVIKKGENIHTENSYKYCEEDINYFSRISGLKIRSILTDRPHKFFSMVLFEKA
jgi:L-histidine N-alpha-methyltransferase